MDLQACANAAFDAIATNSGEAYPHSTINEAFTSFQAIVETHGIAWLIDAATGTAATGTGMSHLGWSHWMSEARTALGL